MYRPLSPCPSCARHVRVGAAQCPFCDAALPETLPIAPDLPRGVRLARGAVVAFGATMALAGCSASVAPCGDGAVPVTDDQCSVQAPVDAVDDFGGVTAAYGLSFPDARHVSRPDGGTDE